MAIQWRKIKNRFQYQQGWFGLFRTYLPSWLGGIQHSQYAYAQRVYQLAPKNENAKGWLGLFRTYLPSRFGGTERSQYTTYAEKAYQLAPKNENDRQDITFNDFINLLNLQSPEDNRDHFFTPHKAFLKETFNEANFTLTKDTLAQIAQHFNAFQTHIKQNIDAFIYRAALKERLFFINELFAHNQLSTTTYFCQLLVPKETLKEVFLKGKPDLSDTELNTLFPPLYAIKDIIDENDIDSLIYKEHALSQRVLRRYFNKTLTSASSAYGLLSTLHHKRYQVLNIPFIDKFLNFFSPPPLQKDNLLHHFIDRLIEDPEKTPTKAELALFNLYRKHTHKTDPYYALIAKHFKLSAEETDASTIDVKKAYRFNALSAAVHIKASTQETATLKIEVYETKLQKMLDDIIEAHTPIQTRHNQRFCRQFRILTVSQPSSDAILSFIRAVTRDDKWEIARFKESDPLIQDLRALHKATKAFETDAEVTAYRDRKMRENYKMQRFLFDRAEILGNIIQGIRTGNCKFVQAETVEKASLSIDGEIDPEQQKRVLQEIKKYRGVVLSF